MTFGFIGAGNMGGALARAVVKAAGGANISITDKYVPAAASIAYMLAFLIGVLFQTDGVDPGGGRTNNLWIIWTVVFIGMIFISVCFELLIKKKK